MGDLGLTSSLGPNTSYYELDPNLEIFFSISQFLFPATFFLLAFLGLIGNSTVLFIICRYTDMQTVTNFFIANLALTDIATVLICILPTALNASGALNMMVSSVCKGMNYIMFVSKIIYQLT